MVLRASVVVFMSIVLVLIFGDVGRVARDCFSHSSIIWDRLGC